MFCAKWFIVFYALIHSINASPYGAPSPYTPYGKAEKITALKLDASVEIESVPAPPMPPRDPYEGGPRIEVNVPPKDEYPKYPTYSMTPEGYGPKKKYRHSNYYKLPSIDVPYYEMHSKTPYSSTTRKISYLPTDPETKCHEEEPLDDEYSYIKMPSHSLKETNKLHYSPSNSKKIFNFRRAVEKYKQQQTMKQIPDYETFTHSSENPHLSISHKISEISSGRPSKDISVYPHKSGGTIINIPTVAASTVYENIVRPDDNTILESAKSSEQMNNNKNEEVELTRFTTVRKPIYKNLLIKQVSSRQNSYKVDLPTLTNKDRTPLEIPLKRLFQTNHDDQQYFQYSPFYPNVGLQYLLIPINNNHLFSALKISN